MKRKWPVIGVVLIIIIAIIGGYAYHERTVIKNRSLVSQTHTNKHTLSIAQIKQNLTPTLSTTHIDATKSLRSYYKSQLENLTVGTVNGQAIVNPYKTSPLSGLILVKTKTATKVTMQVVGDTKATTITKHYKKYQQNHSVGVLGLYASRTNQVKLTFTTKSGTKTSATYDMTTAAVPADVGTNTLKKSVPSKMALGKGNAKLTFAISSQGITYGLDAQGKVRWYSTKETSHVFKRLKNNRLLIVTKVDDNSHKYNALQVTDFYGHVYKQYDFKGIFPTHSDHTKLAENTVIHHDAIEMPNGDFLLTVDDGSADYVEDTMIQIDRQTGKIKKVIDLKRILPVSSYTKYEGTHRSDDKIDWFHQNSMYYDQKNGELIISGRNQDMIFAINYKTLSLNWILAANQKLPKKYQKFLLKPTTKNYKFNAGQHAVKLIHTGKINGNQVELEFYDNNVVVTRGNQKASKTYSTGDIVKIDRVNRTVTKTWSYGKSLGKTNFTNIVGSSYAIGNDNTLINFGYADSGKRSEFVEVNRKTNQVAFDVDRTNFSTGDWSYRAQRMTLFP